MIEITQTSEHGYTIYTFEANNTRYEILTQDNQEYTVYSRRNSLSGRAIPKVYASLDDLAKRSKALRNFSLLIK